VEVLPRNESSTKAFPRLDIVIPLLADEKLILGVDTPRASTIKQNKSSHRKGPMVEPCPGPNNGTASVFL
jgi:hypothetical protein